MQYRQSSKFYYLDHLHVDLEYVRFVSGAPQMISASKDKTLKLWDVAEETCVKVTKMLE